MRRPWNWSDGRADRRQFLRLSGGCILAVGATSLLAACDPFRPLRPPDQNGLRLPSGTWPDGSEVFTSRVVAVSGTEVGSTGHIWHNQPDGGGCFVHPAGGWIYVSNAELGVGGGAAAIRFHPNGGIANAYPILSGTSRNCSGGATPWDTWLSCEEITRGRVWECSPRAQFSATVRPKMGRFKHEACAVDPATSIVYMTEDESDGALYRYVPTVPGYLGDGTLEVLVEYLGVLGWVQVPDPQAMYVPTRYQIPLVVQFNRGEGAAWADGVLLIATTGDESVWSYNPTTNVLDRFYRRTTSPTGDLASPDNIASLGPVGYVAEDKGNYEVVMVRPGCDDTFPVVRLSTSVDTEITGVAFSPDGYRMYFSSQEGDGQSGGAGITYEVFGPWAIFAESNSGGCAG